MSVMKVTNREQNILLELESLQLTGLTDKTGQGSVIAPRNFIVASLGIPSNATQLGNCFLLASAK